MEHKRWQTTFTAAGSTYSTFAAQKQRLVSAISMYSCQPNTREQYLEWRTKHATVIVFKGREEKVAA